MLDLAYAADIQDGATKEDALRYILHYLKSADYHFVTPTPASHARILARDPGRVAADLRDVFGWNLPFRPDLLEASLLEALRDADILERKSQLLKSRVRVSSLGRDLFLHSAYPTDDKDAVFFGPDSYRFARLIEEEFAHCLSRPGARLVDIGAGTGVGAIVAARRCPTLDIIMSDINPAAIRLAQLNAQAAGVRSEYHVADDLSGIEGQFDVVIANPPFIIDGHGRDYRDGGGLHGAEVALGMASDAVPRLAADGRLILYTGSAITAGGKDVLAQKLAELAGNAGCTLRYEELDPDIFGEELETDSYRDIERIALVGVVITAPGLGT